MEEAGSLAWQSRVLSDDELTRLLTSRSPLESMEILAKQMELRELAAFADTVPAAPAVAVPAPEIIDSFDPVLAESSSAINLIEPSLPVVEDSLDPTTGPKGKNFADSAPTVSVAMPLESAPAGPNIDDLAARLAAMVAQAQALDAAARQERLEAQQAEEAARAEELAAESLLSQESEPALEITSALEPTTEPQLETEAVAEPEGASNRVADAASRDDFEEALPIEISTDSINLTGVPEGSPFEILATGSADIASAEESTTEYEESHREEAQPELVDEIIRSVGGIEVADASEAAEQSELAAEIEELAAKPKKLRRERAFETHSGALPVVEDEDATQVITGDPSGTRNARSLLATWNGTGVLLLMASLGYLGALNLMSLESLLSGTFVGLALTGFGFAAAALAARRGHLPQSVLSRAAFGVRGAIFPLIPVLIARLGGTAVLALCAVAALNWFMGDVPASVSVPVGAQAMQVGSGYLVALAVLLVGYLATLFSKRITVWIHRVVAVVTIAGSAVIVALGYLHNPSNFAFGGPLDFASALGTASLVMAIVGMLWGSSAADENPDLRATTMVPKLLAGGLLNFSVLGSLAAAAGWSFYQLRSANIGSLPLGSVFALLAAFAFANLIRRNADTLAGFGLRQYGLAVRGALLVVVAAASLYFVWKIGGDLTWSVLTGYLIFIAVPVLSWLTIFGSDSVLRSTNYHEVSLLRSYGFYGAVNWANLIGWIVATGAGWGFISSSLPEFAWVGYFNKLVGTEGLALSSNLGVWVALGISILVPIAFTIPRIKNQEAEVTALEKRRTELIDVLGIG